MLDAPCSRIDMELHFPRKTNLRGIEAAKRNCNSCEFVSECLEWVLQPASRCDYGVFGGKSEDERKAIVKARDLGKAWDPVHGAKQTRPRKSRSSASA
ncbi:MULTISPECIES: WhiB family transcriptional regulator [unclassified Streptomyces]|uniref:WhiB family transcriptional regulator n=1 Tax=unclassified Streptomyces TaxID=2593676 RepID=UPI0035E2FE31